MHNRGRWWNFLKAFLCRIVCCDLNGTFKYARISSFSFAFSSDNFFLTLPHKSCLFVRPRKNINVETVTENILIWKMYLWSRPAKSDECDLSAFTFDFSEIKKNLNVRCFVDIRRHTQDYSRSSPDRFFFSCREQFLRDVRDWKLVVIAREWAVVTADTLPARMKPCEWKRWMKLKCFDYRDCKLNYHLLSGEKGEGFAKWLHADKFEVSLFNWGVDIEWCCVLSFGASESRRTSSSCSSDSSRIGTTCGNVNRGVIEIRWRVDNGTS